MGSKAKRSVNGQAVAAKVKAAAKPAKVISEPVPEVDSDSDSSEATSDEEEDASSADSDDDSAEDSEDDDDDSDSSDSSDDDETEAATMKSKKPSMDQKPKANGKPANGTVTNGKHAAASDASEDDSDDSDASEDDSDDSDASGSDSDESDSEASEDEKEEPTQPVKTRGGAEDESAAKKRKALDDPDPNEWAKKAKTSDGEPRSTLFVGNLAWAVDDTKLYEAFSSFDGLLGARVMTDNNTGRSRGFGYVDFNNPESATAALSAMNKQDLEGRAINVDLSTGKSNGGGSSDFKARANQRASAHNDALSAESETLFLGNLPFDVDDDTVRSFFGEVGKVVSCRLPTDPESGNPKGFGYVTFETVEDAKAALQAKNGAMLGAYGNSRPCRLDFASSRPPRNGESGGRGGGRGGFGGRGGGRGGGGGFNSRGRGGGMKPQGRKITF